MNWNDNLCACTIELLQSMLLEFHWYTNKFKHSYKLLKQYPDDSDANIWLCIMPGQDQWLYNLSTSDKVAVILPGDGTAPYRQDIILCPHTDDHSLTQIDDSHPAYSPLHYVLLFPNSDHGWHHDLYHCLVPGSTSTRDGILPTLLRLSICLFTYIYAMMNTPLSIEVDDFSNSTLLTCGHLLITYAWLSCTSTKAVFVLLYIVA